MIIRELIVRCVALLVIGLVVFGCKKPAEDSVRKSSHPDAPTLPSIEVLADRLKDYSAESTREVRAHVDEVQNFIKRMKDEGQQDSKPVELSRTNLAGNTVVVAAWERTYTLTPNEIQPGGGAVEVTVKSGASETILTLGLLSSSKLDPTFTDAGLVAALRQNLQSVVLLEPARDGFEPIKDPKVPQLDPTFSHSYRLISTKEKLSVELAEDGKTIVLRVSTPAVELKFSSDSHPKLLSCDFAKP